MVEDPSDPIVPGQGMELISEMIVKHVPAPPGDVDASLQLQVNTIDYSPYLGRLGIGGIANGTLRLNENIVVARRDGSIKPVRISKIFSFIGDEKVPVDMA